MSTTPSTSEKLTTSRAQDTALQPEAAEVSSVPTLLTADEVADVEYENYLEDRFARYGY